MRRYLLLPVLAVLTVVSVCRSAAQTKPVIGISGYVDGSTACVGMTYVKSVREAGGVPFVIPVTTDMAQIDDILDNIDGLVMSGGEDFDPQLYGEQPVRQLGDVVPDRDKFDISLIKRAVERGIPLLGICRGEQGLNIALGGTLYQDIPSQVPTNLKHSQKAPRGYGSHAIRIEKNSLVYKLLGTDSISVNSYHHQAVKDLAPGLRVSAVAPDGVIESVEKPGDTRVIGTQFHPEGFVYSGDMRFLPFFRNLVEQAVKYRAGR